MVPALLVMALPVSAQVAEEKTELAAPVIVERGPHHRTLERISTQKLPNGRTVTQRNSYVELAVGMHFFRDGQWVESSEEIEIVPGAALAQKGQHQVVWAANLNTEGAIDLLAPDGKRFRSHLLGLAYTDATTGQSALIAEPKDCIGEVGGNQVVYRDAFAGPFRADVRYTYTISGFEQDIVFQETPPSPSEYGMDPETTRLEVWTEFLSPPAPAKKLSVLRTEADEFKRQMMVDPDLTDESLDFGAMQSGIGNAFPQETGNRFAGDEGATTVGKSWVRLENRDFLIEKVEYGAVKEHLDSLPKRAALNGPARNAMQARLAPAPRAKLLMALAPPKPRAEKGAEEPMRMAAVDNKQTGFVLDYTMENSVTNFTFWGDQTYYVSNKTVTLSGTTTIHGGTVIKFTAAPNLNRLLFTGPIDCRTAPWRPAIITAQDDDTVGTVIAGSTNSMGTNRYGGRAFDLNSAGTVFDLHDLHFRYHDRNIFLSAGRLIWGHSHVTDGNQGLSNSTTNRVELRNLLFMDTKTGILGGSSATNMSGEHLTFHRVGTFLSSGKIYLTNSLLISVTNGITYTGSNVETNLSDSGIFQTVGFGSHYLSTNSAYRNSGTTNINPTLLAGLKERTTYAPLVLSTNITVNTNLSPQVQRDTDQPDLGYHYLPLDFLVSGVTVASNVTVTATNGVAVGVDYSVNDSSSGWGFILDSARFISLGSPVAFNRVVRAHVVQEKSSINPPSRAIFYDNTWAYESYPPRLCEARFRFTEFSQLMEDGYMVYSGLAFGNLEWSHSRFFNVSLVVVCEGTEALTCGLTNTLWDMGATLFYGASATGPVHLRNNLYRNHGLLFLNSTTNWTVRDNLFERCYLDGQGSTNANSHNAYFNLLTNSLLSGSGNMALTNLTYEGPSGYYYQPASSSLLNTGSLSAASAGLYHFTATTNQVKETNSIVDIGIHYVALNANGQPVDSDNDGVPDYIEDSNGNGLIDPGEQPYFFNALFVIGTNTISASDTAIKNRLTTNGLYAEVKVDTNTVSSDANGKLLVVISKSVLSASVNTKFTSVSVPVVCWEDPLFDDLQMTSTVDGTDYGSTNNQRHLRILNTNYTMAAGLSGTSLVVTASSEFSWGKPNSNAMQVASMTNNTSRVGIFGYEKAAQMVGLEAPARRAGSFLGNTVTANLNANGWSLFDATIQWAIGTNGPPTKANWLTPTNGSTFVASTNITLTVEAIDKDSGVLKVVFYRNGVRFGTSFTPTTNTASLVWSNAPAGNHLMTARVFDQGRLSLSTTQFVAMTVKSNALFIVGSTNLNASETALKNRLEIRGYVVTVKAATNSTSADANGKTVVLISSSAPAANVTNRFTGSTTPVVVWQKDLFDDLGLTGTNATNFGVSASQTNVVIQNSLHPLAAGLSGTVTAATNAISFAWGQPGSNAVKIATIVGDTSKVAIFGYEKGSLLVAVANTNGVFTNALAAPGRRVGFFLGTNTTCPLNASGLALFDAAIDWSATKPCFPALDVMLVVDNSASVIGKPFADEKAAGSNFISQLLLGADKVGLISFAATSVVERVLTTNFTLVTSNLYALGTTNGTRLDYAINMAQAQLESTNHNPVAIPIMILFSDGANEANKVTNNINTVIAADNAKAKGTRLITVRFLSGFDDLGVMQQIASSPADFYLAPDTSELIDIYNAISDTLCRFSGPPSVSVTNPSSGAVFAAPANITIGAAATSSNGFVTIVEFFNGTNNLGSDTTSPYAVNWNSVPAGNYAITAVAQDNSGLRATSAPVNVTVSQIPTVFIITPTNNETFLAPAQVSLTALAGDVDGIVTNVSYFNSGVLIGRSTLSPYRFVWSNVLSGNYTLTAVATDNLGLTNTSASVAMVVNKQPPKVQLLAPLNGTTNAVSEPVVLEAEASDADGTVSRVVFYDGTTPLWTNTTPPYRVTQSGLSAGLHSFKARATDNDNLSTDSLLASVWVTNCFPVSLNWLALNPSTVVAGDTSTATIFLSGPAMAGGQTIILTSDNPFVIPPPTVFVPEDYWQFDFLVETRPRNTQLLAGISASYHGQTVTNQLSVAAATSVTPFLGALDVAFVLDTSSTMESVLTNDLKFGITNVLDQIEAASDGDYRLSMVIFDSSGPECPNCPPGRDDLHDKFCGHDCQHDYVCVLNPLAPGNRWAIDKIVSEFTQGGELGSVEASDEALRTVIHGMAQQVPPPESCGTPPDRWQAGSFDPKLANHNGREASKVIVLVTDSLPGGFFNDTNFVARRPFALGMATNAYYSNIVICAVQVGTDTNVADLMLSYAQITGGMYVQTPQDGSGVSAAIARFFAPYGDAGGGEVIVRGDSAGQQPTETIDAGGNWTNHFGVARFDLRSMFGELSEARIRREGTLRLDRGQQFDLELGIGTTNGVTNSFGWFAANAQTNGSQTNYSVEWSLPSVIREDVIGHWGGPLSFQFLDRWSSVCGGGPLATDTPQEGWPLARNELTLLITTTRAIPQGRCRDLVLSSTNSPLNGWWDVVFRGTVVASSGQPRGWDVEMDYTQFGGFNVSVPTNAATGGGYQVRARMVGWSTGKSARFEVAPATLLNRAPVLLPLVLSTNVVTNSTQVTLTVALDAAAPAGGAFVTLKTSGLANPGFPAWVVVPPGATFTTTNFTQSPGTPGQLEITAAFNGYRKSSLRVVNCTGASVGSLSNLVASTTGDIITLTWNAVTNATSYRIEHRIGTNGAWNTIFLGLATNRFVDPQAMPPTTNQYRVFAVNDCATSAAATVEQLFLFSFLPPAPVAIPNRGTFHDSVVVLLTNGLAGSQIYYSTNDLPTTNGSSSFSGGGVLEIGSTVNLYAFTVHPDFAQQSLMSFARYVIQSPVEVFCAPPFETGPQMTNGVLTRNSAWSTVYGPGFYSSRFKFVNEFPGQVLDWRVSSTNFDTVLLLMDAYTNLVAFNDDAVQGETDSRIFTMLPTNGTYYLEVTSYFPEEIGSFALTTECVSFPEINVLNAGGTNLAIGSLIELGVTNAGAGLLSRTLTISNAGTATLTLSNYVIAPTNFLVAQPSPSGLDPGQTQTFTVKLTNNVIGEFYGQLDIYSDDSALDDGIENPFVLFFHGRVDPAPAPPTVSILFPTNGMVIPDAPVNTEIVATAADADGIQRVELYIGTTLLTTVTTPPYRTNWNNVAAGQYTLTARAYDSNNIATTSSPVVVTIGRPTITLAQTAPCVGMIGTSQRTITATVKDAGGAPVQSVQVTFTVTGPNALTTNRTTIANGTAAFTYTGAAQGYDRVIASATVSSINITSSETNLSWAGVTNCAPMNGLLTTNDGPSIGCQCSTFARYADFYRFTANSGQTVTFRMRSFDFEPLFFILSASSCQVLATNFVVNSSNALRSFTVPSTGDYFVETTSSGLYETGAYTLEVECSAPGATQDLAVFVSGAPAQNGATVDFGTTTVGTPVNKSLVLSNAGSATLYFTNMIVPGDFGLSSPLPATLDPSVSTNFTLYLTNSVAGQRGEPLVINSGDPDEQPFVLNLAAIVNPAGTAPSVTLTQPAANTIFSAPATMTLAATASASGGAVITNVDFIYTTAEGSFLIGHDTNAPYTAVWSTDVPGAYALTAAAYDSVGRLTLSAPVNVEVRPLSMNRPPEATNDSVAVAANSVNNTFKVLANDRDPDFDALTIVDIILADTRGTVTIIDAGTAVRYTPPRGIKGNPADGFYYVVSDGKGGIDTAKVEVAVEASDVPLVVLTNIPSSFCVGMVTNIQALVSPWQNVTNVEFYLGKVKLGATNSGVNGVFTLPWNVFANYCQCGLTAAAYDRFGQRGVTTSVVDIDVERCNTNAQPPVARLDNLAPVVRAENKYSFLTTPTIRQGFFTLQGAAYHTTNGVPVSYAVLLLSTTGELLRDLTPSPGADGFHSGAAGGISATSVLASCDFTTLENGVYDLLLQVRGGGDQTNAFVRFVLESDLKLGPFGFTEQDLTIPVSGLPLTVLRTYNSLNPRQGDFGYSWTYSLVDMQVVLDEERTDVTSLGDEGEGPGGMFSLRTGGGRNVTLTLPDGRRTTFFFDFEPVPGSEELSLAPIWHSAPGVNAKLEVIGLHQFEPLINDGIWKGDGNTGYEWYEFPGWILTAEDGTQFVLEREQTGDFEVLAEENPQLGLEGTEAGQFNAQTFSPPRLSRIVQRSGDEIRIQRERTDSDQRRRFNIDHVDATGQTNRSVVLERDGQGRIIAISDPLGQNGSGQPTGPAAVKYEYDAVGNLSKVLRLVDRAANGGAGSYLTNRYFYEHSRYPHYLTRIEDARGVAVARNLYDDSGKLIGVIDAAGRTNRFEHDMDGRRELLYDRLGQQTEHFYDDRGNVTRTINALGESVTRQYDASNYLIEEVNARGETNRYAYDDKGNRTAMTNALGHVSLLAYSDTARLLTALDPLGHGVTNAYDSRDNLAQTINALGQTSRFLYDTNSLLVSQVNALDQVVSNRYNANGWLTSILTFTNFSGGLISSNFFAYDANGNRTNETLVRSTNGVPAGTDVTTSVYDALNRLVLSLDALGRTNRTVYDAAGRVESVFDALNRETRLRYDARGLLTNITYPDLTFEVYAYDAEGRRTNGLDRLGRSTSFVYDALGRLARTIYPDGATQATVFDEAGRVTYTVDARGVTNAFGYDAAGRRVAVTNGLYAPEQQVLRYEFDAAGNLLTMADGTGRFVEHEYDALNRRLRTLYPPSAPGLPRPFTATAYDAAGRRVFETNEAGVVSQFTYDALGRLAGVTNAVALAEKTEVSYDYDTAGNLTLELRPGSRNTRFEYDGLGRRTRRILPGSIAVLSEGFRYDTAGNLAAHTNFNGQVITNAYDVMNRLVSMWHGSTQLVAYTYTPHGLRASASNEAGVVSWVYDTRDRVRTNSTPAGVLRYDYDLGGNLTNLASTTSSGVRTAYANDALGRLTNVTDSAIAAPNQSAYRYDAAGNLIRFDQPSGVTHQWRHDARHRLTNLVVRTLLGAGLVLGQFDYALANTGQRVSLNETNNGIARLYQWGHDALHRLTNDLITGAAPTGAVAYVYDVAHNRTKRTSTNALNGVLTNQNFTFDNRDRLDNDANTLNANPWYDANGNPTNYAGNVYQYDWANRLTTAVVGGTTISLGYDAAGNRVKKTVGTTTTLYLVSTINPSGYAQVMEEKTVIAGATNLARAYTYGLDLISQRVPNTSTNYFVVDGLGSTRVLTDCGTNVVNAFAYDAYGSLIASNGVPQTDFLFAGEQWDTHLRLYNNRARYLDPGAGRFLNRDTFEGNNEDPLSLHKYLYVHANPANNLDPSGNWTLVELKVTVAGIATTAAFWIQSIPGVAREAFARGGSAIGNFFYQFGPVVQNFGRQVIELLPNVERLRPFLEGFTRRPDFLLRAGDTLRVLEAKYQLPSRAGEALARMSSQLQQFTQWASQGPGREVVVWALKKPDDVAKAEQIVLQASGVQNVRFVYGVEGLFEYLLQWAGL